VSKKNIIILFFFVLISICSYQQATAQSEDNKKNQHKINIKINGISKKKSEDIIKNISLFKYQDYAVRSTSRLMLLYSESKNEIKKSLQPYGYFNATVTSTMSHKKSDWNVIYNIKLGVPIKIILVDIHINGQGKDDLKFKEIIKNLPLKKEQILTQIKYNKAKDELLSTAAIRGYFDAKLVKHEIRINAKQNTASIYMTINTGDRYRINKINLTQSEYSFYPNFLHKFIAIDNGSAFNNTSVQKTITNLQSSNYFGDISIIPQIQSRDKKNKTIDVNVDLTASKPITYSVGGGYGTYTGFRALAETVFHHLTPSGHYASISVEISQINLAYIAQYIIPGSNPLNNYWSINAQQNLINIVPYRSLQSNAGVNNIYKNRWLSSNIGIQQYYITYVTQDSSITQDGSYLVPNWYANLDLTKPDGFWRKGVSISNSLQGTIKNTLSSETFIRNLSQFQISIPIMSKWNRIIMSGNVGFLALAEAQNIAPQFRFYAGGVGNLLGYDYLSQGPKNTQGQLTGGRYLGTISAGLQQRVYGDLSILGYYNMGNATNSITFDDVTILRAAGGGIGYETPVGSIQGYLTRTLNKNDMHWKIDISLGVIL
jgi:translocation and assembly module TamA